MKIIHEHKIKWILIIVISVLMLGVTFEYKYLFKNNPCWFYRGGSGNPTAVGDAYDKCLMPNADEFMFFGSCNNSSMPNDNQLPTCMEQDTKFNYYSHLFGIFNIIGYILLGVVFIYILIDIYRFGDDSGYIKFIKKIFDNDNKDK